MSLSDELRELCRMRREVVLELGAALCAAVGLFVLAPRADAAAAEGHALYAIALALASLTGVRLVARVATLLRCACPRCREPVHGAPLRALATFPWLPSACVHCGLPLDRPDAARPEAARGRY